MSKYSATVDKAKYRSWASEQAGLPLYMSDWWLDIVSHGAEWSAVIVQSDDGTVTGALPFVLKKYYGMSVILPPLMTAYSGPWIGLPEDDRRTYIKTKMQRWEIQTALVSALPHAALSIIQTSTDIDDSLPFTWQGYRQSIRYTFLIEDISDPQKCFEQFKGNIRTNIRKAERQLKVISSTDPDKLYDIHNKSFAHQEGHSPIPRSFLKKLYHAAAERQSASIHLAVDDRESVYAGVMVFSDEEKVYVLISGVDRSLGNVGALNLLYWHVIQIYAGRVQTLDFEGSMLEGVAPVFLSFGAKIHPYFRLIKYKNKLIETVATLSGKGV